MRNDTSAETGILQARILMSLIPPVAGIPAFITFHTHDPTLTLLQESTWFSGTAAVYPVVLRLMKWQHQLRGVFTALFVFTAVFGVWRPRKFWWLMSVAVPGAAVLLLASLGIMFILGRTFVVWNMEFPGP